MSFSDSFVLIRVLPASDHYRSYHRGNLNGVSLSQSTSPQLRPHGGEENDMLQCWNLVWENSMSVAISVWERERLTDSLFVKVKSEDCRKCFFLDRVKNEIRTLAYAKELYLCSEPFFFYIFTHCPLILSDMWSRSCFWV